MLSPRNHCFRDSLRTQAGAELEHLKAAVAAAGGADQVKAPRDMIAESNWGEEQGRVAERFGGLRREWLTPACWVCDVNGATCVVGSIRELRELYEAFQTARWDRDGVACLRCVATLDSRSTVFEISFLETLWCL